MGGPALKRVTCTIFSTWCIMIYMHSLLTISRAVCMVMVPCMKEGVTHNHDNHYNVPWISNDAYFTHCQV